MFGRISKEILPYDSDYLPTKVYQYNFDGIAPEKITIKQKTTANNTLDVNYFYDGFGNLVQIKTPFESGNQILSSFFVDEKWRISGVQTPFGINFDENLSFGIRNLSNISQYTYDALSRVVKVTNPDGTFKRTNYSQFEINDYDENSNKHTYHLDAYGRIVAVTEYNSDYYLGDNQTFNTTYSYNGRDELTGIRDSLGNNFNFSYDSLGRKVGLDDPDLGIWSYQYDLAGNLGLQTDNKGNQIRLSYDPLNRVYQKNTTPNKFNFTYDLQYQGTLSRIEFGNNTYSYTYDELMRPIRERRDSLKKQWNLSMEKEFTFDSMSRINQILEPNGRDIDIYYNHQNKISRIKGWINQSSFNAIGNVLNRSYNVPKISNFDYYSDNLRLKQIKTDTIQILNYSHDPVGNIIGIQDQVNNRPYSMSYDKLDRLTNVSIGDFKWVYQYDSIGNMLKIIRNNTETTSRKYDFDLLAHAPYKIITSRTGVDVHRQEALNTSNRSRVVDFFLINERNSSLERVNWTSSFDDGNSITSNVAFNLSVSENVLVVVEHNYSRGGSYIVNLTGRDSNSSMDYERVKLIFGAIAKGIDVLRQNASNVVTSFTAKNDLGVNSLNWNWSCTNGVLSTAPFNMSSYEELLVVMEHNYSLSSPNLTCRVYSGDGNQSKSTTLTFNGIKIENYNSTLVDVDTILVKFSITNYFATLSNIKWNISSNGNFYNGSISSLNQLQSYSVSQEINFGVGGRKELKVSVGVGNFTDSYTEYYYVKWIELNQFFSTLKNATTRIFDFFVTNRNSLNTSTNFTINEPALNYSWNLSNNESLIVVIEQDFSQGDKTVNIKVFNRTLQEDVLVDIFKVRQVAIDSFQTLYQNNRSSIISSIVRNNIAPLNVGWKLDNSESLINSTQGFQLNTSEQMIVIIESNFSDSGIYPLKFFVNSSGFNDNTTGVAVT